MTKAKPLSKLRVVRANGGFKLHLLPTGSYTSLCGHSPKNLNYKMRRRGRWLVADFNTTKADCEKCIKEAAKRGYKDY